MIKQKSNKIYFSLMGKKIISTINRWLALVYPGLFFMASIFFVISVYKTFQTVFSSGSTFIPVRLTIYFIIAICILAAWLSWNFAFKDKKDRNWKKLAVLALPGFLIFGLNRLSLNNFFGINIGLSANAELFSTIAILYVLALALPKSLFGKLAEKRLKKSERQIVIIIPAVFAIIFFGLTLLLHYSYNTGAFDLGIYDRVVWLFSQLKTPYDTFIGINHLGDHFEPILILLGLFYRIWPHVSFLLFFEAVIVSLGFIPIYYLSKAWTKSRQAGLFIGLAYLSFLGIWEAVYFPIHPGSWLPTLYGFAFLAFYNKRYFYYYLCLILAIACKESAPLEIIFVGLFIGYFWRSYRHAIATVLLGLISFCLIFFWAMPYFAAGFPYIHNLYGDLAATPLGIIQFIVSHPVQTIKIFFGSADKVQTFYIILGSTGFLAIASPLFLLVILPLLAERLLTNFFGMATINYQYSAPVAIFIFLSAALAISKYGKKSIDMLAPKLALWVFLSSLIFALASPRYGRPLQIISPLEQLLSQQETDINAIIKLIPKNASVIAQDPFTTHISHRDHIGLIGSNKLADFEFILLAKKPEFVPFPLSQEEIAKLVIQLRSDANYRIYAENDTLILFQKF